MISTNLLITILVVSLVANVFLIWFARRITIKYLFLSENIDDLAKIIINYRQHLKTVYETEMFYGDETLGALIEHTRSLSDLLQDYEVAEDIFLPLTDLEGEENVENPQEENEEEPQVEKDVFYAGSRRRNS